MDYILYLVIFYIGAICGSFIYLTVSKRPIKRGKHKRIYCTKCKHKLGFYDLVPILSYIVYRGKCRYCKKKIKPTGFLIEILTGVIFVIFAASINFRLETITVSLLIYFLVSLIYLTILMIIAGHDKKNIEIDKTALVVGFCLVTLYMILLYAIEPVDSSFNRYVLYLVLACVLVFFSVVYLKRKGQNSYTIDILMLSTYTILFAYETVYIYTVLITLLSIAFQLIIQDIKKSRRKKSKRSVRGVKKKNSEIPIGFYIGISNIIALIATNFVIFYFQI